MVTTPTLIRHDMVTTHTLMKHDMVTIHTLARCDCLYLGGEACDDMSTVRTLVRRANRAVPTPFPRHSGSTNMSSMQHVLPFQGE